MTRTTLYLNLGGENLVLDFSDNGGLHLPSKILSRCDSTYSGGGSWAPFFHFEQCPADGGVYWVYL